VIDDVLQHHDQASVADHVGHRWQVRPVHRGEGTPVHGVTGEALGDLGGHDVDGHCGILDQHPDLVQPLLLHQHRTRAVTGGDGPGDHFRGLRDVQPALGFEDPPQRDVGQVAIVGQSVIRRRIDPLDAHPTTLAESVTCPKTTRPTLEARG
jgi:hypothetical protein